MLESMLKLNKFRGGTAAVIIEPCGPESGTRPVSKEYNKGVRYLCDKYGALLIFDEVVTGFRTSIGGARAISTSHRTSPSSEKSLPAVIREPAASAEKKNTPG